MRIGKLNEEIKEVEYDTHEKLDALRKSVSSDGTYSYKDGKLIKETLHKGYMVSFFRPEIKDDDIKYCLYKLSDRLGQPYIGIFVGEAEISYCINDPAEAMSIAKSFNQYSIWDNAKGDQILNDEFDGARKVDYKQAVQDALRVIADKGAKSEQENESMETINNHDGTGTSGVSRILSDPEKGDKILNDYQIGNIRSCFLIPEDVVIERAWISKSRDLLTCICGPTDGIDYRTCVYVAIDGDQRDIILSGAKKAEFEEDDTISECRLIEDNIKDPRLVDKNGKEIKVGDEVVDFRGDKAVVTGWIKPKHPGSTGRVSVKEDGGFTMDYFPSVYDLHWEGLDECMSEGTVKQNGKWVNRGKDGAHGKFNTKKAADAQRRAMFANGYRSGINEDLKVIAELGDYKPWSGAVRTYDMIKDAGKLDDLERFLEELYPEGIGMTELNDLLWFDDDYVLSSIGMGKELDESKMYKVRMTSASKSDEDMGIKGLEVSYDIPADSEKEAKKAARKFDGHKRILDVKLAEHDTENKGGNDGRTDVKPNKIKLSLEDSDTIDALLERKYDVIRCLEDGSFWKETSPITHVNENAIEIERGDGDEYFIHLMDVFAGGPTNAQLTAISRFLNIGNFNPTEVDILVGDLHNDYVRLKSIDVESIRSAFMKVIGMFIKAEGPDGFESSILNKVEAYNREHIEEKAETTEIEEYVNRLKDIDIRSEYSEDAIGMVRDLLAEYGADNDIDGVVDAIPEYIDSSRFIYYNDCFKYLQNAHITDFEEAMSESGAHDVTSIAIYYLDQEMRSIINRIESTESDE